MDHSAPSQSGHPHQVHHPAHHVPHPHHVAHLGPPPGSGEPKFGIPPWLQQILGVLTIVAAIFIWAGDQKADSRSTREEVNRLSQDINAIRTALPNREVVDMKLNDLEKRIASLEQANGVRSMLDSKLREDLIKAGVIK